LALLSALYAPRVVTVSAQALPDVSLRAQVAALGAVPWPLEAGEQQWLAESGVQSVERFRFNWQGEPGSIMIVVSDTWRAQHRPERCFEVYGLAVEDSRTEFVAAGTAGAAGAAGSTDFPVRLLSLSASGKQDQAAAAYWLQSRQQTTDDFATRIWADLAPQRETWVLVTVLFDRPVDPGSAGPLALYTALRGVVQERLEGEAGNP
jgi:exosortase O